MKLLYFVCLVNLFAASTGIATSNSGSLSPVSRVVELLQSLSKQVEAEGKKEENLYETYVCWAKSVIETKTATNAAAESRKDMLTTYIADLDSGRIELTSERADLEQEIEELMADIELADATRKKENSDFLQAEDEMQKAIDALQSAIDVLKKATKDHKDGVLLAVRQRLNGGMEALLQEQTNLKRAVDLGERFLTKADSLFLRRLLFGEVPVADWKKLNRKATFKMSYKARSFKIQAVLEKMHSTFTLNLKDAKKKEADAKDEYDNLKKAKTGQLDASRNALSKMDEENGAKGLSRQEAVDEVAELTTQIKNDEKFIQDTEKALATKKTEWKDRQDLRAGELEAISKAIYILHNDDARDLMKRSMASQEGFLFLQVQMTSEQKAANGAANALRDAARRSGDQRLFTLAANLAAPAESVKDKFKPVIAAIDKMIKLLESDEKKDLEIKETCETDRMSNTRKAILAARAIDEMSETIMKLEADIKKLGEEIQGLEEEHKKVTEELAAAKKIRQDENAAWLVTDKDDKDAATTIKSARSVLQKFYADNNLVLTQQGKAPVVKAGEAPPPPPPTWEGAYGGKTGESMGIVALLDMLHEDIVKDRSKAKAEEDASQKEFDEFEADSKKQMKALTDEISEKEKIKGKKETSKTDTSKSRSTKKGELDGTLNTIKSINPNCEYFEVNYVLRVKNRQIELDGLQKAKIILTGGSFTETNPDREIKPGDAASASFLQIRRK